MRVPFKHLPRDNRLNPTDLLLCFISKSRICLCYRQDHGQARDRCLRWFTNICKRDIFNETLGHFLSALVAKKARYF